MGGARKIERDTGSIWQVKIEGYWQDYNAVDQITLNNKEESKRKQFTVQLGDQVPKFDYDVDLTTMTQKNKKTGTSHQMRKDPATVDVWKVKIKGSWIEYDGLDQATLNGKEASGEKNFRVQLGKHVPKFVYTVDLTAMTQKNEKTRTSMPNQMRKDPAPGKDFWFIEGADTEEISFEQHAVILGKMANLYGNLAAATVAVKKLVSMRRTPALWRFTMSETRAVQVGSSGIWHLKTGKLSGEKYENSPRKIQRNHYFKVPY